MRSTFILPRAATPSDLNLHSTPTEEPSLASDFAKLEANLPTEHHLKECLNCIQTAAGNKAIRFGRILMGKYNPTFAQSHIMHNTEREFYCN